MLKPNATLEKFYFTGKKAFGTKLKPEEKEAIRMALMNRYRDGVYVFKSRSEKRRLRCVAPVNENVIMNCVYR